MSAAPPVILLIEDSRADARLLSARLDVAFAGARITHASTLSAGLDRLAQEQVDVVLLDPGLPDSFGIDSCRSVLARATGAPVLVVSGFEDSHMAQCAVTLGAEDYLVKDAATPDALGRAIRRALARPRPSFPDKANGRAPDAGPRATVDPSVWLG